MTSQAIAIVSISVLLHQTVGSLFFSCLLPAPWASSSLCPSLWPMAAAVLLPTSCHSGLLDPLVPLDQGSGHADCPFDPTKIYVSPIIFSAFLQSTEPGSCPLITRTCHSCLTSSPCLPPFLHLLGHSLGSLDPFCVHVCSRGCSVWLLLCGCTHPAWGRAL